jgi:hypothetical protein
MRLRINVLCLIGLVILALSCVLPWLSYTYDSIPSMDAALIAEYESGDNPIDFIIGNPSKAFDSDPTTNNDVFIPVLGAWVFLVGIFVALITPLAGIVQIIGEGILVNSIMGPHGHWYGTYLYTFGMSLSIGFFLAVIGSVIILISILFQLWVNQDIKKVLPKRRLLTWEIDRNQSEPLKGV